jgi:hypothetical protein
MGFKPINPKRCLALVGMVLLVGAVRHEPPPPAAISKSHLTTPVLTYARMDRPQLVTNSGFLDKIYLSLDPPEKIHDPDLYHANLNFQSDLPSESYDKLPPQPGDTTKPRLTVADRKLNYELFGSGNFAFKLNLKPAYPYPEALIPTGLDPGFGLSLKF